MTGQQKAHEPTGNLLVERLAREIGMTADAKHIYGELIEREGVTVIPVAKAVYGFGGGGGKKAGEEGSGGGGGVSVAPVGYIEIKNGETRFRQIIDSASLLSLAAIGSISLLTVFWGISKLLKIRKRGSL